MCGICGAWLIDNPEIEKALGKSLTAMRHRGPDGEGTHFESGVALGMRRLAVIDVEGGQQPLWNETNDVGVIFNGEIYNYLELLEECRQRGHALKTRSDTEVIVHLYEDSPEGFVERLRGMFAIAIFDRRRQQLVLARDRFGKKPLFYAPAAGNGLVFASELKGLLPLLRSNGMQPEIEPQAIYDFLSLGSVPQPATVYKGVMAVPPGHLLVADRDGHRLQSYWNPTFEPKFGGTYEEAQILVRQRIEEAVRLRLRSDVPIGCFLSAGIDSSIVTHEASKVVGDQLRTFTVASDDPALDESSVASRTARQFGVRNTVLNLDIDPVRDLTFLVNAYDQPFADASAIPSLEVSRAAREQVTVVLSGDGGDELFGGYRRHVATQSTTGLAWLPQPLIANIANLLSPESQPRRSMLGLVGRMLRGVSLPPEERYLVFTADMLREADKRSAWHSTVRSTESLVLGNLDKRLNALDMQMNAELRMNLLSTLLVKADIANSAHSLEGRSPFLDHELAEIALRLPANFRVRGRRPKAILRDAYSAFLPKEVVRGKKRGFEVPLAAWLQGPWHGLVNDCLGASDARSLNFVDRALLLQVLDPNSWLDRNKAYITYAFLVLELWLRSVER